MTRARRLILTMAVLMPLLFLTVAGSDFGDASAANVQVPPTIAKSFSPATVAIGAKSTLSILLTNPAGNGALVAGFTDTFPGGMLVASPPNVVVTGCGGSTPVNLGNDPIGAGDDGIRMGGIALPDPASCCVSVDVIAGPGSYVNTTNPVGSSAGTGGQATATLNVVLPLTFTKAFGAATIPLNATTILTFTISNPGATPFTNVGFTDPLPAGLRPTTFGLFTPACLGNGLASFNSVPGATVVFSGFAIPANTSCVFPVVVQGVALGIQNNVTTAISSTQGGTGTTASASITVISQAAAAAGLAAAISGSTANGTTKVLDAALLTSVQQYLALPNGIGKTGACIQLSTLRTQTANSLDAAVIAARVGPSGWLAQIDILKAAIGCPV